MRRVTRKKLKQDEFVSTVDQIFDWLMANWRPVVGAVAAVVVVFLVWLGASALRGQREEKISLMLSDALQKLESAETETAETEAEEALRAIADSYTHSRQADVARVLLAKRLAERDQYNEARDLLIAVSDRDKDTPQVRVATLDLIHLRVASGQAAQVIEELEQMVSGQDQRLPRDVALFELADVLIREKKRDEAKKYLEKLVEDFPESTYTQRARERLRELG